MTLNFTGAGPPESAEWALARRLVNVLSMPLQLLDPFKPSLRLAIRAGRFRLGAAHTTVTVVSGILDCWMFSSSQRPSLGHINMHSNHGKPNGAYLVRWKIVLRAQLEVNRQSRNRGHWESVVEVQRSRGFTSIIRCWPSVMVTD